MQKLLFTLLIGLLITACQDDSMLMDSIDYDTVVVDEGIPVNSEVLQPNLIEKLNKRKINVKSSGFFRYVHASILCDAKYTHVEVHGTGKTSGLGEFDLFLSYCRDVDGPVTPPQGYQDYGNGDVLFTSLQFDDHGMPVQGEDQKGFFLVFDYEGGTGIFKNARGWVKLYFEFDEPIYPSIYKNHGKGVLTY